MGCCEVGFWGLEGCGCRVGRVCGLFVGVVFVGVVVKVVVEVGGCVVCGVVVVVVEEVLVL